MKKLQRFCATVVLTLVLAFSAFAGDILIPGATKPLSQQQSSVTGDISMPGATSTGEILIPGVNALDPVTEAALSLIQGLLSLF
ncbi:MAG TPA: hypothetical protein VN256_03965 [Pyrinomonadaceae bacterium]|nr:hypothetical protein [Pyrinomonadaceae bacterium]